MCRMSSAHHSTLSSGTILSAWIVRCIFTYFSEWMHIEDLCTQNIKAVQCSSMQFQTHLMTGLWLSIRVRANIYFPVFQWVARHTEVVYSINLTTLLFFNQIFCKNILLIQLIGIIPYCGFVFFFQISKCQHANLPNADGKCDSNSTSFVTLSLQLCINEASQSNSKTPKPSIVLTKYLLKKSILISPYWTVRHCVFTVNALACSPRKKMHSSTREDVVPVAFHA